MTFKHCKSITRYPKSQVFRVQYSYGTHVYAVYASIFEKIITGSPETMNKNLQVLLILSIMSLIPLQCAANPLKNKITLQVDQYIKNTWDRLTRKKSDAVKAALDTKISNQKYLVYISRNEDMNKIIEEYKHSLPLKDFTRLQIKYLPRNPSTIKEHGLLYLPYPYVVPGGRFNEMHGWDSYFIELGLLKHGRISLARNMVDNLIYEVNYYGTILNANRTYFMQRSHPPLLTEMVLAYFKKTKDKKWLKTTLPAIKRLYKYWMTPPHLIKEIGLSRYYAGGVGPTPEELPSYYEKVRHYYQNTNVGDYDKKLFYDPTQNQLTPLFYIADRTVRESGFDISAKFGPFGAGILDYASVDLNVLLYQMEKQTSEIYQILNDKPAAEQWLQRAEKRAELINKYMWNESLGYYFDYNFKTHYLRPYVYATTFYPLWAGIASKEQANRIVANLPNLLAKGGIVTSAYRPKSQWDAPFGWAPFQYFAVKGLLNYGYQQAAQEIAKRFIGIVNSNFEKTHLLFEKYDVQDSGIYTENKINYGYNSNEIGFGWTNGVYLSLLKYTDDDKPK